MGEAQWGGDTYEFRVCLLTYGCGAEKWGLSHPSSCAPEHPPWELPLIFSPVNSLNLPLSSGGAGLRGQACPAGQMGHKTRGQ